MEIENRMTAEGHVVASLTGGLEGQARDVVIDAFRSGKAKVLLATNVLSRGIDVQSVSLVVNYVSYSFARSISASNQARTSPIPEFDPYEPIRRLISTG